jgi:hypothetical protein
MMVARHKPSPRRKDKIANRPLYNEALENREYTPASQPKQHKATTKYGYRRDKRLNRIEIMSGRTRVSVQPRFFDWGIFHIKRAALM